MGLAEFCECFEIANLLVRLPIITKTSGCRIKIAVFAPINDYKTSVYLWLMCC